MFSLNIFKKSTNKDKKYYLIVDVGYTRVRGVILDSEENIIASSVKKINTYTPKPGWSELDPHEVYTAVIFLIRNVLQLARLEAKNLEGLGLLTNPYIVVAWDRRNNMPVCRAINEEDERSLNFNKENLKDKKDYIKDLTGLEIDRTLPASKMRWIIKNVSEAGRIIRDEALLLGGLDAWLLWNLTDGDTLATDYSHMSQSGLFNIEELDFDKELLNTFDLNINWLPEVKNSKSNFGVLRGDIVTGELPILFSASRQSVGSVALSDIDTMISYGRKTEIIQRLKSHVIYEDLVTILLPNASDYPEYGVLSRASFRGETVIRFLKDQLKLKNMLTGLVEETEDMIDNLPTRPKEVLATGKMSEIDFLILNQAEKSQLEIKREEIDVRLLGALKLMIKN